MVGHRANSIKHVYGNVAEKPTVELYTCAFTMHATKGNVQCTLNSNASTVTQLRYLKKNQNVAAYYVWYQVQVVVNRSRL